MKDIIFTPIFPVEDKFYPEPASKNIPEWYKKTESFINSKTFRPDGGSGNQTIKKCIPVFDALSAGYIIKTYVDIYVTLTEDNVSYYNWPSFEPISFHPIDQAPHHPGMNNRPYPKWNSPWSVQTPRGYSSLFISPMHNPNGIFTILPGVVDTDQYINPVNFPFTLDDPNFEGLIPAGTTICQVIPFKRDSFSIKIGDKDQLSKINKFSYLFRNKFVNNYKSKFWNSKRFN
jgi:hypothetical protein